MNPNNSLEWHSIPLSNGRLMCVIFLCTTNRSIVRSDPSIQILKLQVNIDLHFNSSRNTTFVQRYIFFDSLKWLLLWHTLYAPSLLPINASGQQRLLLQSNKRQCTQ